MKCGKEPIGSGRKAVELRFVSLDSQDSLVSSCLPESLCSTTRQSKAQDKSRPAFFLCLPLDPRQQQAAAAAEPGGFPSRHFKNLLLRCNHSLIPLSPPFGTLSSDSDFCACATGSSQKLPRAHLDALRWRLRYYSWAPLTLYTAKKKDL